MEEQSGYLGIILGPMFSGKTSHLIQIYKKYIDTGKRIVVINHASDTRYTDKMLSSHDRVTIPCIFIDDIIDAWKNTESPFFNELQEADIILINEGQFFNNLKDIVLEMVEESSKMVVLCGLDGDFKRNPFGEILSLIPYCDSVEKLSSLCLYQCENDTPGIFTHRLSSEDEQIVVGSDNYIPLCRSCYRKKTSM